jgi:hypothetical protein
MLLFVGKGGGEEEGGGKVTFKGESPHIHSHKA